MARSHAAPVTRRTFQRLENPLEVPHLIDIQRLSFEHLTPTAAASKRTAGTAFKYQLSEPATVAIKIQRKLIGYRQHNKCRKVNAKLRHKLRARLRKKLARKYKGDLSKAELRKKVNRAMKNQLRSHRCPKRKKVGVVEGTGQAGANQQPFSGWVGDKALRPGKYKATAVATDAGGNHSKKRTAKFKVVRG